MNELARTPRQLGNVLRRARKQAELTQARLGERAGLRQETISLIERGNPAVRLDTLLAVLATLDLELRLSPRTRTSGADFEDLF